MIKYSTIQYKCMSQIVLYSTVTIKGSSFPPINNLLSIKYCTILTHTINIDSVKIIWNVTYCEPCVCNPWLCTCFMWLADISSAFNSAWKFSVTSPSQFFPPKKPWTQMVGNSDLSGLKFSVNIANLCSEICV